MKFKNITFETFVNNEFYRKYADIIENDIENRIKYATLNTLFNDQTFGNKKFIFFVAFDDNKVIGILKLKTGGQDSIEFENFYNWLSFCSIDEKYQNNGIAKQLINNMFDYMNINELDHLLSSGYTQNGIDFLSPYLNEISKKYNIKFAEKKEVSF